MSRKHSVSGFKALDSADATISQKSQLTDVLNLDGASYHVNFSSANSGQLFVEARNGKYRADEPEVGWYELSFGSPMIIASETDVQIVLNELPFDQIRLVWSPSSGSGTITAKLTMKTVGA